MSNYILVGKKAILCKNILEWARWFEKANRRIKLDKVGPLTVSTVFLGLDHAFGQSEPQIFETMIFGGQQESELDESYCERYSTWDEAERGHEDALQWAKGKLSQAEELLK